ncbi:MAG TPA: divalent metal cation transporter [Candidatus Paceibacterota bacterium]|nr:divalent metal cation transporter [Candidatus Paceibacterota bacterium]
MKRLRFFKKLGPGLITGASDDDPSGILTYLQGGTMLGFGSLWTTLLTLPMMCAVQEMAGRIGLATDKGIVEIIKKNYSKWVLFPIIGVSTVVLVINIGADLLAIGTAISGMVPISNYITLPFVAALILLCTIFFSYREFASALKWLTISLLFYVLAVLYLKINWLAAIKGTLIPYMSFSKNSVLLIAAIFGTTVSPYLFFWQTDEEIEEKIEHEKKSSLPNAVIAKREITDMRKDVFTGMAYSNIVAWFIIAGGAAMAGFSGVTDISNFSQASLVLRPLLGESAYLAFVLGIVGTGLLVIPVLAGNIGYMFSEAFGWERGINKKFREAKGFYLSIIIATFVGLVMDFIGLDPVMLLVYTALFYALITPPIIYIILKIANNKKIMGEWVNSKLSNFWGIITLIASTFLVIAYFATLLL